MAERLKAKKVYREVYHQIQEDGDPEGVIAAALRAERVAALEEAAVLADKCDKSTHPADVADFIRQLKEQPT